MIDYPTLPYVERLPDDCDASNAFRCFRRKKMCCWLDSALAGDPRSRYSFLCFEPVFSVVLGRPAADPLAKVQQWLDTYKSLPVEGLPPFQGGVAGFLSYEFGRCIERIPAAQHDEFSVPLAVLGLYDVVLSWDHEKEMGWVVSQGFPECRDAESRLAYAKLRAQRVLGELLSHDRAVRETGESRESRAASNVHAMAHGLTAPQFETRLGGGWLGNFDSHEYQQTVQKARDYIYAGDIFQVNLSQRLLCPARCDSATLYERLRTVNSAPFAGYFDYGDGQIISASPERFLQMRNGWIETRPIKGTRRRSGDSAVDKDIASELKSSEKDRSENIMIVDLLRNDLSRVCEIDSLRVDQLCEIEAFPFVLHLVSSISAKLRPDATFTDLIAAVFPGGSITGAPKVRAMEIIAELEPTARGPYCGSLGYYGTDGSMDWNILIRTLTASRGWWQFQVGGGIVAESDPAQEEEETWTKAAGIVAAIDSVLSGSAGQPSDLAHR